MKDLLKEYLKTNEMTVQNLLNKEFIALIERVTIIEEKVFPDIEKGFTLNQQIIALDSLGIIQILRELKLPQIKMAELLGLLIKRDTDSVKKALAKLASSEDIKLKTEFNYTKVSEKFSELGLKENSIRMEQKMQKLKNKKI